ncbi:SH3 domain-containing protein [Rhodocista pekingensis]|uniref:SH3 domain-containing protein n=1 Tax=Rhodocista pekingensis TaxID=201185 RepID=A0ABW2L012_9PROT
MMKVKGVVALALAGSMLSACVSTGTTMGGGSSVATGSAGAAGTQNANAQLERCDRPLGTIALVENQPKSPILVMMGLTSPIPAVRLVMQQTGCFRVVARGDDFERIQQERALAAGGSLQAGSNLGGGQLAAADFIVDVHVLSQNENAGGTAAGLGAFVPGIAGAVLGGLRTKESTANVMLTVTDVRTGVQEAVATGSAESRDIGWAFGAGGFGSLPIAGGLGGYENTEMGKTMIAAIMDAVNKLVPQFRAMPQVAAALKAPQATPMAAVSSVGGVPAATPQPGTTYRATEGVNLRGGPGTSAEVIGQIAQGAAVQATGEHENGWFRVRTASGQTGWVAARTLRTEN